MVIFPGFAPLELAGYGVELLALPLLYVKYVLEFLG
jgi:hypothetical protein